MRWTVCLVVVVLLSGCADVYSNARDYYSSHYHCPDKRIKTKAMSEGREFVRTPIMVSGCDGSAVLYCDDDGCTDPSKAISKRHSRQFSCSPEEVVVKHLDGDSFMAAGCGQEVTYICVMERGNTINCILESAKRPRD